MISFIIIIFTVYIWCRYRWLSDYVLVSFLRYLHLQEIDGIQFWHNIPIADKTEFDLHCSFYTFLFANTACKYDDALIGRYTSFLASIAMLSVC